MCVWSVHQLTVSRFKAIRSKELIKICYTHEWITLRKQSATLLHWGLLRTLLTEKIKIKKMIKVVVSNEIQQNALTLLIVLKILVESWLDVKELDYVSLPAWMMRSVQSPAQFCSNLMKPSVDSENSSAVNVRLFRCYCCSELLTS